MAVPDEDWRSRITDEWLCNWPGGSARAPQRGLWDHTTTAGRTAQDVPEADGLRRRRRDPDSEVAVARDLAGLDDAWAVVHDLPIDDDGGAVDHLVIGPGGVFALTTQNLQGIVWVAERALLHDGRWTRHLEVARAAASGAADRLGAAVGRPVEVRPALVVLAGEVTVRGMPRDVEVIRREHLVRWLRRRPVRLGPVGCAEVEQAARRPGTWPAAPGSRAPGRAVPRVRRSTDDGDDLLTVLLDDALVAEADVRTGRVRTTPACTPEALAALHQELARALRG